MYQVLVLERQPGSGDLYFFRRESSRPKTNFGRTYSDRCGSRWHYSTEAVYSAWKHWKSLDAVRLREKS